MSSAVYTFLHETLGPLGVGFEMDVPISPRQAAPQPAGALSAATLMGIFGWFGFALDCILPIPILRMFLPLIPSIRRPPDGDAVCPRS